VSPPPLLPPRLSPAATGGGDQLPWPVNLIGAKQRPKGLTREILSLCFDTELVPGVAESPNCIQPFALPPT
jgi:hypothetical protein